MGHQRKLTRRGLFAAGTALAAGAAVGAHEGRAAAMAAKKGCLPRELKVAELQDALRADGVAFDVPDREQKGL